jgi:hypothetical protein
VPLKITEDIKSKINNQEDEYYVVLGGYNGGSETTPNRREEDDGKLMKDINNPSDIKFLNNNKYEVIEIKFNNNSSTYKNDSNVLNAYNNYNGKADYPWKGVIGYNDYNSNSLARTTCEYGGGSNCNYDFKKSTSPLDNKIIPKNYFTK